MHKIKILQLAINRLNFFNKQKLPAINMKRINESKHNTPKLLTLIYVGIFASKSVRLLYMVKRKFGAWFIIPRGGMIQVIKLNTNITINKPVKIGIINILNIIDNGFKNPYNSIKIINVPIKADNDTAKEDANFSGITFEKCLVKIGDKLKIANTHKKLSWKPFSNMLNGLINTRIIKEIQYALKLSPCLWTHLAKSKHKLITVALTTDAVNPHK